MSSSGETKARAQPEDFLHLIRRQKRGRLKIYLGSSAGVGKTYQMLREGNRLKRQGIDVVIGYVEPHDRPETSEQIGELEIIPARSLEYHGIAIREMDLAATLARRPAVALVDELAHTNAPGSRNEKRYEDVEELLSAGISVISTLNIQHLESLYNIVESATGVRVKERIPDAVVSEADQLVNVDLPAEDLLERLEAGKIYPLERVERAMGNFFTQENLTRLREITMSETANFLDRRQRRAKPEETRASALGNVMVALSSAGPKPEALLRKTARLAEQLNAQWWAVYVRTPQEDPIRIDAERQRRISGTLELAQKMGGIVILLKNSQVSDALVSFAREYGITHVVMGRPPARRWWQRFRPSLLELLSREIKEIDLVIV